MQKTFNVWVRRDFGLSFTVCSKRVEKHGSKELIDSGADFINSPEIRGCDVSQWLETLEMELGKVKSFKLTFKEN